MSRIGSVPCPQPSSTLCTTSKAMCAPPAPARSPKGALMCCRGAFKCSAQSTSFRTDERSLSARGHLDRRPKRLHPSSAVTSACPKTLAQRTLLDKHCTGAIAERSMLQTYLKRSQSQRKAVPFSCTHFWPSLGPFGRTQTDEPWATGQRFKTCKQKQENRPRHYCLLVRRRRRPATASGTLRGGGLCA